MFYLGIDVSLKSHRCVLIDNEGEKVGSSFTIPLDRDGFTRLVDLLRELAVPVDNLVIGMEATGLHWENLLSFLESRGFRRSPKLLCPGRPGPGASRPGPPALHLCRQHQNLPSSGLRPPVTRSSGGPDCRQGHAGGAHALPHRLRSGRPFPTGTRDDRPDVPGEQFRPG